ncbi:MAG: DUF1015 domain-containing protein [Eubacteriales bacterium]|nr:DUF1015 domain-containing protein [Eubacteriales bacterium]
MRDLYFGTGELLLPAAGVDPTAWACIACDQYTSQPEYWRGAAAQVGDRPSALNLILPECFLGEAAARVPKIHQTMRDYLAQGVVTPAVRDGFILTERSTGSGARVGLVGLMDLEGYEYQAGSRSPIRATEGTIVDRIPPRLSVRRGAALELSHVLALIDDPMMSVVEPIYDRRDSLQKLYDFPLMLGGGHLVGYAVTDPGDLTAIFDALRALKARVGSGLLYAVGDGNHSLATAKAYWEEIKPSLTPEQREYHPARFAMVELENIHDDALTFEPIHRVLYGYDGDTLLDELARYVHERDLSLAGGENTQEIDVVFEGKQVRLSLSGSSQALAVSALQTFLDDWMPRHPGTRLDYVHGEESVRALVSGEKAVGFLLPAMDKSSLFPAVEKLGALPRKTFSMGAAHEKRYYMEARRLG